MPQDTLQLNSSLLVRLCIALMRTAAGQDSPLNEAFAKYALHALVKWQPRTPMHQIFADPFDETERAFLRSLALCSLPEAFEKMVQRYNLHLCQSDLPFLQALFDLVIGFSNKKISDMGAFLQWWERQGGAAAALAGGGGQNAVVVDTIHKSKGLEYRAVIVPFADWELNPKANSIVWMHCPAPPYNEIEQLPLSCSAAMGSSFFAEQYAEEKTLSFLDNLNLLYVALTRARDELYVYVPAGAGRAAGRISDALQMAFANFDPARFAPARLTLAEEGVFEFGSPAPCAAAPAPVPQSAPVVWNAYFSRGPVPALRVRRGEGQGGFVPL